MAKLKLIQLNVEGDRHWDKIIPFLERESPDVMCLQELFEQDVEMLAERFGYRSLHVPIVKKQYDPKRGGTFMNEGVAIFTNLPLSNVEKIYYYKAAPELRIYGGATVEQKRSTIDQAVAWGTVEKEGTAFMIATTHFTWTPDGMPNKNQDADLAALLKILDTVPTLVLCGDFNAPRGDNRIYRTLAERYKDNIPPEVTTTLDTNLHRIKSDPLESAKLAAFVVDYIFSTPEYSVDDVRCEFGLSDHCAVIATITREQ